MKNTTSVAFVKNTLRYFQPEAQIIRRALSMAIGVFAAVLIDHFYSVTREFWVPMIAFLVIYMTVHLNLRQMLERVLMIFFTVACASWLCRSINQQVIIDVMVVLVFIVGYGLHANSLARGNAISIPLLVAIVVLMMLIPFPSSMLLYARMHDVVLGGIVGLAASLLVFPGRPDVDFRKGVIPVLQAYREYLVAIIDLLFREPDAEKNAKAMKVRVEQVLQVQQAFFPDWVYDTGFNPELQQGHRHFLIKIEQLGQVLFALHQIARHAIDVTLLEEFREPILHYVAQTERLMALFVARLNLQKVDEPVSDYTEEIAVLEKTYRKVIQVPLELLDTSQDFIDLAAFIHDLKDIQKILIKIAEALR
jgi:uncharacterized membrane protein YccC